MQQKRKRTQKKKVQTADEVNDFFVGFVFFE